MKRTQLVIDKSLTSLPRRQTDGAIVLRSQDSDAGKARVFKLNANPKDPVLIERCAISPPLLSHPADRGLDTEAMSGSTVFTAHAASSSLATNQRLLRSSQDLSYIL